MNSLDLLHVYVRRKRKLAVESSHHGWYLVTHLGLGKIIVEAQELHFEDCVDFNQGICGIVGFWYLST